MLQKLNRRGRGAFTLVEIMFVVAIIALLAAVALPNFLRARKRAQAAKILEDLRVLDAAIDLYAIENNKITGSVVNFTDIRSYLKTNTALYNSGGVDLFGNAYGDGAAANFAVDTIPKVHGTSFGQLSDVAPATFWSPYR